MVIAGVDKDRFLDPLGLGVLGRPLHQGTASVRIGWAVEEVEGSRRFGVRVLSLRIGKMRRIGAGDGGDLVARDETDEGFCVGRSPSLEGDHSLADPLLVKRDGFRSLVGVVHGIEPDFRSVDTAIGIDLLEGVRDTRTILFADKAGRSGVVGQMANENFIVLRHGGCANQQ